MIKINTLNIPKSEIRDLTEQESQDIKGGNSVSELLANRIGSLSAKQPELSALLGRITLALQAATEALAAAAKKP